VQLNQEPTMKTLVLAIFVFALAMPVAAATIWDETINGDLSDDPAAPTPIAFPVNLAATIKGSVMTGSDYITFTVPPGATMTSIWLTLLSPGVSTFTALNAGSTSYVPFGSDDGLFLSGIFLTGADSSTNLLFPFDTRSVTPNSLPAPSLGPGTYCWMMYLNGVSNQHYEIEFIITGPLATEATTWGKVKALYR
jgi:hypothetical protein